MRRCGMNGQWGSGCNRCPPREEGATPVSTPHRLLVADRLTKSHKGPAEAGRRFHYLLASEIR